MDTGEITTTKGQFPVTDTLKPYSTYKHSGVEWLGEIPAHWAVRRLKDWVTINRSVLPETTDPDFVFQYIDIGSVSTGVLTKKPQRMRFAASPSRARRIVREGDTIISTVRTYLKAVWFAQETHDNLICSTGFAVLTPDERAVPKFVSYLVQSHPFIEQVTANSVGMAYPAIAERRLGSFHLPLPPLPEQEAIVRYLGYVERRIRRYIDAKQKLVGLLKELKQATIHEAVTRGLDPDVPLKPSGVEWLGHIPAHWRQLPGKVCYRERKKVLNTGMRENTVLSLSYGQIVVKPPEKLHGLVPASFETYQIVDPSDIIVRPTDLQNDWNSLRFGLCRHHGIITSAYMCLHTKDVVSREYGYLLLHAYDLKKVFYGLGSGLRQNLRWSDFKYLPCLVPPLPEQEAIAEYLDKETTNIDTVLDGTRREIELLQEYRTVLIADVVSGKVDVREVAANLPDDADDAERRTERDPFLYAEEHAPDC